MNKAFFYIYNIIKSDDRYTESSKTPMYCTCFLLAFFEVFAALPIIILFLSKIIAPDSVKSYLMIPLAIRYFIIFGTLIFIFYLNLFFWTDKQRIARIMRKYEHKKNEFLKYKWLLLIFTSILGILVLISLRILKASF